MIFIVFPKNSLEFFQLYFETFVHGAVTDEERNGGKNEDKQHDGVGQVVGQLIEHEFASIRDREDSIESRAV